MKMQRRNVMRKENNENKFDYFASYTKKKMVKKSEHKGFNSKLYIHQVKRNLEIGGVFFGDTV